MHFRSLPHSRRGAIVPLTACLLIPLLALVAFAVDIAWITHTHNELQSAADAAGQVDPARHFGADGRRPCAVGVGGKERSDQPLHVGPPPREHPASADAPIPCT
jgi:hypothetical protein